MHDSIYASHRGRQRSRIGRFALNEFDVGSRQYAGCPFRITHQAARMLALCDQAGHEMSPYVSGRASNEYHKSSPCDCKRLRYNHYNALNEYLPGSKNIFEKVSRLMTLPHIVLLIVVSINLVVILATRGNGRGTSQAEMAQQDMKKRMRLLMNNGAISGLRRGARYGR